MKVPKLKSIPLTNLLLVLITAVLVFMSLANTNGQQNLSLCQKGEKCAVSSVRLSEGQCGVGSDVVQTSIRFGCKGDACVGANTTTAPKNAPSYCTCTGGAASNCATLNPIVDILFAIIRFLSDGVGIVVVLSVIIGGVQYITSRGDPNSTQAAIKRLTSALLALIIFIFAYALLNYVIPNGFFKP